MWINPFLALGAISLPFFFSNLLTFFGFLFAAYFSLTYVVRFFEDKSKPMSWIMIVSGLTAFCFSELGQFLLPYRVAPTVTEAVYVLAAQNIGIILIVIGTIMMFREVTS